MSESYSGEIPPIADNEKKGRKIKPLIDPAYIQELITKGKITPQLAAQLPNQSVIDYINERFTLNIPAAN